jgi:acetoacetate decarboxylase
MREEIVRGGFSTPLDAPMIPRFPFGFRDVEILTLTYRSDEDAMRGLLPEPLELRGPWVMIHCHRMNDTSWLGPYQEVNMKFGAALSGAERGSYSPCLFLSSDVGVTHGREVHGQPKKLVEPRLRFRGDLIVGTLARNGIDVMTGTMPYKQERAEVAELAAWFPFATNINLKAVNHIDGTPAIRQLTSRTLADVEVRECWRRPCTVELRPNAQAPVHRLPVREMVIAYFWRAGFTLVPGRVLLAYLKEEG